MTTPIPPGKHKRKSQRERTRARKRDKRAAVKTAVANNKRSGPPDHSSRLTGPEFEFDDL